VGLIPVVVVFGWYAKNLLLFDEFAASTWFGMNLFRIATGELSQEEVASMVQDGQLPPVAMIRDFSPPTAYQDVVRLPEPTGYTVLDAPRKHDGTMNLNHLAYVAVGEAYRDAALSALRSRPDAYGRAVLTGLCRYMLPSSDYWALVDMRAPISAVDKAYNGVIYGQMRTPPLETRCNLTTAPSQFPFLFPFLFLLALVGASVRAVRSRTAPVERATMAFIAVTILWVTVVGNAVEFGDNNRFRFVTEPLMWVALGVVADRLLAWRTARRGVRDSDAAHGMAS
jgi:hypothetical protein